MQIAKIGIKAAYYNVPCYYWHLPGPHADVKLTLLSVPHHDQAVDAQAQLPLAGPLPDSG